jgi:hypothetical protein
MPRLLTKDLLRLANTDRLIKHFREWTPTTDTEFRQKRLQNRMRPCPVFVFFSRNF